MRRLVLLVAAGLAFAAGIAAAKSPWPGLAGSITDANHGVRYVAGRANGSTTVYAVRDGRVGATLKVDGSWGVPAVTSTGAAGGLSADGRTLVLVEPSDYRGLRTRSRFLVLSTNPLALRDTVELKGEFSFDALSPNSRWLYVIQHVSAEDLVAYRVRGYDLQKQRLLPGAIVAKGEGETMRGYPVARATTSTGNWVYTLYHRDSGKPFVHALQAAQRFAVCIDLPTQAANGLRLSRDGRHLTVRLNGAAVATIDTRSFKVT
jgi:hypothetical protein